MDGGWNSPQAQRKKTSQLQGQSGLFFLCLFHLLLVKHGISDVFFTVTVHFCISVCVLMCVNEIELSLSLDRLYPSLFLLALSSSVCPAPFVLAVGESWQETKKRRAQGFCADRPSEPEPDGSEYKLKPKAGRKEGHGGRAASRRGQQTIHRAVSDIPDDSDIEHGL